MKRPFTIYERKWITNGKVKSSFQYLINEPIGLPSYICKEHQRKAIRAKNKTEASRLVLELIKKLENEIIDGSSKDSFGNYTKDYMLDGKCHLDEWKIAENHGNKPVPSITISEKYACMSFLYVQWRSLRPKLFHKNIFL